jgi:hypothetical protein
MSWARRLKRVFGVEIERCTRCGGQLKIIASIEVRQLIAKILSHLERAAPEQSQSELPLRKRGGRRRSSGIKEHRQTRTVFRVGNFSKRWRQNQQTGRIGLALSDAG